MEDKPVSSFHRRAARAGWILPLVALAVMVLSQRAVQNSEGRTVAMAVGVLLTLLLVCGFASGLLGALGAKKLGERNTLIQGLAGSLLSIGALGLLIFFASYSSDSPAEIREALSGSLKAMVELANQQLPRMTDPNTRADKMALLAPDLLAYDYTLVNEEKKDLDMSKFAAGMRADVLAKYLSGPNFKPFRDGKISIRYTFRDKNGEVVAAFTVPGEEPAGK